MKKMHKQPSTQSIFQDKTPCTESVKLFL